MSETPKQIDEQRVKRTVRTWSANEMSPKTLFKEGNIRGRTAGRTEPKSHHLFLLPTGSLWSTPARNMVSTFDVNFGKKLSQKGDYQ